MKKKKLFNSFLTISIIFLSNITLSGESLDIFSLRRQHLLSIMSEGIAVIPSRSGSGDRIRDNKFYYYLTGRNDQEAVLLLSTDIDSGANVFVRSNLRNAENIPGGLIFRSYVELQKILRELVRKKLPVFVSFADLDVLNRINNGFNPFSSSKKMINLDPILKEIRVIKSEYEIGCLSKAIDITADGLVEVFKAVTPGMKEYDLAAIMEYSFSRRGSPGSTFLQAASGPNSTFVHYGAGERVLEKGDMIVFDVGAEFKHYTADISRTIPVDGRFNNAQKEIYTLVLRAQKAAIEIMLPGKKIVDSQKRAEEVLMQGLFDLGLVIDKDNPWQKKLFIQHGFYHFIGLDIHDVWYYYREGIEEKKFEKNMVITMEPGLYFPEKMLDEMPRRIKGMVKEAEFIDFVEQIMPIYRKYKNIGVRIEDDILIMDQGNRILSSKVPKEIKEIEKLMKENSPHNKLSPIKAP